MSLRKQIIAILLSISSFAITTAAMAENVETAAVSFTYGDNTYTRQMEKLDRGLVAIKTDDGVYLSWRLSGEECSVREIKNSPDFEVYRNGEKIATVKASTNYIDRSGTADNTYSVAIFGKEQCDAVAVYSNDYIDIPMDVPADFVYDGTTYPYILGEASTGDLDGDGQYELVVKWNANPQDNANNGVTGNVYLDAYELTGEKLWRIDLGRNIRAGEHYTQFLVYDFDLDGYAEITAKTAPGSIDGEGKYVSEASLISDIKNTDNTAIYINETGRVLDGDEFFTVFDGRTGKALDTIYYPNQRIRADVWGDDWGNRCDRFLADVAYLDGEMPYAVYWRGYYGESSTKNYGTRTGIFGARLDENKRLQVPYCFDTYDTSTVEDYKGVYGYSEDIYKYTGQGNHNITVADVDNDGKDEFISGALCMEVNDENKLMPRWCSYRGHGDALHIADYDPTHPGFEYFSVHESGVYTEEYTGKLLDYGMTVYDANTGEELIHRKGAKDTQGGIMANVGAGGYYQTFCTSAVGNYTAYGNGVFKENGIEKRGKFRLFRDGDLYDETMEVTEIFDWNGSELEVMFDVSEYGCISVNRSPSLQADLFGDWREEVLFPLTDYSALRLFMTTDIAQYKLPTLMHDPVYRSGVAAEQTAYNQPPHIGFYLSEEIFGRTLTAISITPPDKTEYKVGEELDTTGMRVFEVYNEDEMTDDYDYEVTDYTVSGYNPMVAGEQEITVTYKDVTQSFTVTVITDFICDENGYITGYEGSESTETIPEYINGIEIRGIAENALENTGIEFLYVYNHIEDIKSENLAGVLVGCYEGSAVYRYAVRNGADFVLLSSKEYALDIDFGEDGFDDMKQVQTTELQTSSMEGLTFVTNLRSGSGDGKTGFIVVSDADGNKYMQCGAGRWSNGGRHAYMTIDNPLPLDGYVALSFDVMLPYTLNEDGEEIAAYISIEDENGNIDKCSVNAIGAEFGQWYNYSIVYSEGEYISIVTNLSDKTVSVTNLGKTNAKSAISKLQIYIDPEFASVGKVGAEVYMDNFRYYTCDSELEYGIINTSCSENVVETVVGVDDFEDVTIYVAEYNEDGRLTEITSEKIESNYKSSVFDISSTESSTIKAMLWQGMNSIDCKIVR